MNVAVYTGKKCFSKNLIYIISFSFQWWRKKRKVYRILADILHSNYDLLTKVSFCWGALSTKQSGPFKQAFCRYGVWDFKNDRKNILKSLANFSPVFSPSKRERNNKSKSNLVKTRRHQKEASGFPPFVWWDLCFLNFFISSSPLIYLFCQKNLVAI